MPEVSVAIAGYARTIGGWLEFGMFGFVPDPLEDELLYGVLARYASMWGLEASSWFAKRTLGVNTSPDMPRVGMFLAQPMPASWRKSADEIIDGMTTAKYYEHGRTAVNAARYRTVMAEHVPLAKRQKTGVRMPSRRKSQTLRWCAACAEVDRQNVRLATWHRVHQLPLVHYCPRHGRLLLDSGVSTSLQSTLVVCPHNPTGFAELRCPFPPDVGRRLAKSSQWLLDRASPAEWRESTPGLLRRAMEGQPWFVEGTVRQGPLARALASHFGDDALDHPVCMAMARGSRNINRGLKTPGGLDSEKMLLLTELCGRTAEDLLVPADRARLKYAWETPEPSPRRKTYCEREPINRGLRSRALPGSVDNRGIPKTKRETDAFRSEFLDEATAGAARDLRGRLPPRQVTRVALYREVLAKVDQGYSNRQVDAAARKFAEPTNQYHARRLQWLVGWLRSRSERLEKSDFFLQVGSTCSEETLRAVAKAYEGQPPDARCVRWRTNAALAQLVAEAPPGPPPIQGHAIDRAPPRNAEHLWTAP